MKGLCAQLYAHVQNKRNTEKHQFSQTRKQMNDLNEVNVPIRINKLACAIVIKYTSINTPAEKQKAVLQKKKKKSYERKK